MNLEAIEQECLAYLMQVSNPLAPLENLVRHLRSREQCAEFTEAQLLQFLRQHELFKVIEPAPADQDPDVARQLAELGVPTGPRVVLVTRIPTSAQIAGMLQEQLEVMTNALAKAMAEAKEKGDTNTEDRVLDALARAEKLKKKIRDVCDEDG